MHDKPGLTGASPLSDGDLVAGRYRIRREVGRGGYAIVYKAEDLVENRILALKTIRPITPRPDEVRARFRREAELASRLRHPNTVRVFDYGFETDFFLAMEFLEGSALSDVLDGMTGIDPRRALRIAHGVLESLTEAHGLGIVHRDLKPENVFLVRSDAGEVVKVLDFGIAKAIHDDDSRPALTLKGRAMGTPTYMSPEQAKGAQLTVHSDIYAVGVLLYEMLCGVPPFQGDNAMEVMLKHVNEPPPRLTLAALRGTVIDDAISRSLSKSPSARFESAAAFLAALGARTTRQPDREAPLETEVEEEAPKRRIIGLPKQHLLGSWFRRKN
jgi:serine/threonine protein kinase